MFETPLTLNVNMQTLQINGKTCKIINIDYFTLLHQRKVLVWENM